MISSLSEFFARIVTRIIRFLLNFTWHISRLNSVKIYLNQNSFKDNDIIDKYEPQYIFKRYKWIVRKFEDPSIMNLGIMHHGFVIGDIDNLKIMEYGCETELKIDAAVQIISINQFIKESLDNEFYIYEFDQDHLNDFNIIEENIRKRLGEKKYNFLSNTCEDLCVDILIKPDYHHQYQNQIRYLLDIPNFRNFNYFYKDKTNGDKEILKKFVPCKYDKNTGKIIVYKNPLV